MVGTVFAVRVELNHDFVINLARMVVFSLVIFFLVVLKDEPLLAFLNAFPIGFKRDIEWCISSEDELRRRGSKCRVHCGV